MSKRINLLSKKMDLHKYEYKKKMMRDKKNGVVNVKKNYKKLNFNSNQVPYSNNLYDEEDLTNNDCVKIGINENTINNLNIITENALKKLGFNIQPHILTVSKLNLTNSQVIKENKEDECSSFNCTNYNSLYDKIKSSKPNNVLSLITNKKIIFDIGTSNNQPSSSLEDKFIKANKC